MDFSKALIHLKLGCKMARSGWNGKGMFIYLVEGKEVPVTALNGGAYNAFKDKLMASDELVKINSHIDMKAADNSIVVGWLASQTDILADDWGLIVE